jgi:uncharacterized protein YyaL (SSP411 family)
MRHPLITVVLAALLYAGCCPAWSDSEPGGGRRLAATSSPYLRMHADNPVEWYPWGEEAFARAERENKLLFISVGYFSCHWCHVMERESFMDPEIAELLNRHFISIKVDREQRPDIDAAYMRFLTLTRGIGGWPMTVFATPEGYPFAGGVYFPPTSRDGHTGLRELLEQVRRLWQDDPQRIEAAASAAVLQIRATRPSPVFTPSRLDRGLPAEARRVLRRSYDELAGGFGEAPKFPQAAQLLFLLQSPDAEDRGMALHTLDAMIDGGIHDQLAGGFHRYATDALWRVPHFEKMLYDQALNARACLAAWQVSGQLRYAEVTRSTLDFALARMRAPDGSFHAALAADSLPSVTAQHSVEGAFYTWDSEQWQTALPDKRLRRLATERYGVRDAGNLATHAAAELAGRNVLYRAATLPALAERHALSQQQLREALGRADRLLLAARSRRPAVARDDKVVAAWNGYMITALAEAGRYLEEPRYLDAARRAAEAVLSHLYDPQPRRLYRDYSAGRRGAEGFARDYAALAEGLLSLHAADGEARWLALAAALTETQLALFWDDSAGGFFNNRADKRVWLRDKPAYDGVEPGVNAISIGNLLALADRTDRPALLSKALRTAGWAAGHLADSPAAMPYALLHWPALVEAEQQAGAGAAAQSRQRSLPTQENTSAGTP